MRPGCSLLSELDSANRIELFESGKTTHTMSLRITTLLQLNRVTHVTQDLVPRCRRPDLFVTNTSDEVGLGEQRVDVLSPNAAGDRSGAFVFADAGIGGGKYVVQFLLVNCVQDFLLVGVELIQQIRLQLLELVMQRVTERGAASSSSRRRPVAMKSAPGVRWTSIRLDSIWKTLKFACFWCGIQRAGNKFFENQAGNACTFTSPIVLPQRQRGSAIPRQA